MSIEYGDLVPCSIAAGESRRYHFWGTDGERIVVTAMAIDWGAPGAEVIDPSGQSIALNGGFTGARIYLRLASTGVYTVRVFHGYPQYGLNYTVLVDRLSPVSPTAVRIAFGSTVDGTIDPVGDADLYYANGRTGDIWTFSINLPNGGNAALEMYDPLGDELHGAIGSFWGASITVTLKTTGPVTMRVSNTNYTLRVDCVGVCDADPPSPPLAITTSTLGSVPVFQSYAKPLAASGGTLPYTSWTVSGGMLPPGLSLNSHTGVVSGTPRALGKWTATIQVRDWKGVSVSRSVIADVVSTTVTFTAGSGSFTKNGVPLCGSICRRGFSVAVIDELSAEVTDVRSFDTWSSEAAFVELRAFVESIGPGHIVMAMVIDESGLYRQSSEGRAVAAMFSRMGSRVIGFVNFRDSWVFAARVGSTTPLFDNMGRWIWSAGWEPVNARFTMHLPVRRSHVTDAQHVLWQNFQTGTFGAAQFDGIGVHSPYPLMAANANAAAQSQARLVGSADFDGDGHEDLLFQNRQTGVVEAWLMSGATLRRKRVLADGVPPSVRVAGTGSFWPAGRADIVVQDESTSQAELWLFDGTMLVSRQPVGVAIPAALTVVGAADLNGDYKSDLLMRNPQTGVMEGWYMNGGIRLQIVPVASSELTAGWNAVAVGDVSGDGRADIIFHHPVTRASEAWIMFGTSLWRRAPLERLQLDPLTEVVAVGHFDGVNPFTDAPIQATVTVVRARHITELRERVDDARVLAGLSPFAWTDPEIVAGVTSVKYQHLIDLRQAIREAYVEVGRALPSFTETDATTPWTIRAVHLAEVREAVALLE